jgi:glycosyltransferase involved in cell wall biosynthesis
VKRLRVKYDHVRLVLVGDNSQMPGAEDVMQELREQAKPLGSSVVFTGAVERVEPLIKGFDIGTCVSRPQNEGIPNSLLEAMAAGKPVVATRVDNIEEAVEDGRNGFLVESDNVEQLTAVLERLVIDPALRTRLGAEGRRLIASQFTTTAQYAQYGELYERLLARRAQGWRPLARRGAWPEALDLARLALERRLPL